jgi:tRNA(adenine34) deaminase
VTGMSADAGMRDAPPGRQARHEALMRRALAIATSAGTSSTGPSGDVPVGALVVAPDGTELGAGHNEREATRDPTAHAEMVALRAAAAAVGSWRLDGTTLVVTLEPCTMCAGALVLARVATLVFGAWEPKTGAVGSLWDVVRDPRLTHRPEVYPGVLADECAALLRGFFTPRRQRIDGPAASP